MGEKYYIIMKRGRENINPCRLYLLSEPLDEVSHPDDVVAVVVHREPGQDRDGNSHTDNQNILYRIGMGTRILTTRIYYIG